MLLWIALFLWIGSVCWYLCVRLRVTVTRTLRTIAFRPRGAFTPSELFGCLLSGNLAVLERDDFNQLASALPVRRAQMLLRIYGSIESRDGWWRSIENRLGHLGELSSREEALIAQWHPESFQDTEGRDPLQDVCTFLASEACVVSAGAIQSHHLNPMAWDVQQAAYMVRLGLSAGYVEMAPAQAMMIQLQREALQHYASWPDYFLSSLVGMGLRHHVDVFSPGDWHRIAQSYTVLVSAGDSLLRHASPWLRDDAASMGAHRSQGSESVITMAATVLRSDRRIGCVMDSATLSR